jgi:hypothetical protein
MCLSPVTFRSDCLHNAKGQLLSGHHLGLQGMWFVRVGIQTPRTTTICTCAPRSSICVSGHLFSACSVHSRIPGGMRSIHPTRRCAGRTGAAAAADPVLAVQRQLAAAGGAAASRAGAAAAAAGAGAQAVTPGRGRSLRQLLVWRQPGGPGGDARALWAEAARQRSKASTAGCPQSLPRIRGPQQVLHCGHGHAGLCGAAAHVRMSCAGTVLRHWYCRPSCSGSEDPKT